MEGLGKKRVSKKKDERPAPAPALRQAVGGGLQREVKMLLGKLKGCLNCPICQKLFCEPTSVSECIHIFCRKCIYGKITEGVRRCPVCYINLGSSPLEKLRPDHKIQGLLETLLSTKRRKVDVPEKKGLMEASPSRAGRTPHTAKQTKFTGRKSIGSAKKAGSLHRLSPIVDMTGDRKDAAEGSSFSCSSQTLKKVFQRGGKSAQNAEHPNYSHSRNMDDSEAEGRTRNSSSPETLKKMSQSNGMNAPNAEHPNYSRSRNMEDAEAAGCVRSSSLSETLKIMPESSGKSAPNAECLNHLHSRNLDDAEAEGRARSSSSCETLKKTSQSSGKSAPTAEQPNHSRSRNMEEAEGYARSSSLSETLKIMSQSSGKSASNADIWTRLNLLVDVANREKDLKSRQQGHHTMTKSNSRQDSLARTNQPNLQDDVNGTDPRNQAMQKARQMNEINFARSNKSKVREMTNPSKLQDDVNGSDPTNQALQKALEMYEIDLAYYNKFNAWEQTYDDAIGRNPIKEAAQKARKIFEINLQHTNKFKFLEQNKQPKPQDDVNNSDSTTQAIRKARKTNEINLAHTNKSKVQEHTNQTKPQDDVNSSDPTNQAMQNSRKMKETNREKKAHGMSAQALVDSAGGKPGKWTDSIWVSLVAATNQNGGAPLPQISKHYLRIKDGTLPATFVHKYLAEKLNLGCADEVELTCRGRPVNPTTALHRLVDLLLETESSEPVLVPVGASAEDLVMELSYSRKIPYAAIDVPPFNLDCLQV